jgi:hypothetical protein
MKKAFDILWRHGLLYKILDKIHNSYWRVILESHTGGFVIMQIQVEKFN